MARLALVVLLIAGLSVAASILLDRPQPSPAEAVARPQPAARPSCPQEVEAGRKLAATLPPEDLSRRYAEADLNLAQIEANGGEIADCRELVERAVDTVRTHRYALRPGQALDVPPQMSQGKRASE